ncbi:MAG TPA: helix-turn-helix transcriptional regulator [Ideonella sp.]|nr:helix-turn-helix transcriptional regulator [Ideonella sp.]
MSGDRFLVVLRPGLPPRSVAAVDEWFDTRTRRLAIAALLAGIALLVGLEYLEEPDSTPLELLIEGVKAAPMVAASVGVALLFRVAGQHRAEQRHLLRDLALARQQGQQWRAESRSLLNGLGEAISAEFGRWHLTDAEREVALLLLKGLSTKEIAAMREGSERTVREHAGAIYSKAGLAGRAALSAYFLEDLLAPMDTAAREPGSAAAQTPTTRTRDTA